MRPILLALVISLFPGVALAQMYRWVDAQGEVHITDDIDKVPEQYRPRRNQVAPPAGTPARPGITTPGGGASGEPIIGKATLWLRTGGARGEQEPILIQTYENEAACLAERDRRTAVHVSQGMQRTSQPGLVMSNLGASSPAGSTYFAYRCAPAGIRPP